MSDTTLIVLVGLGLGAYFVFMKPPPAAPLNAPFAQPNVGAAAGYAPPAGYPSDPGDRNSWAPAIAAGIGTLGGIVNNAINSSNSSTSSGTDYGSDYSDY